jgi:Plavaka transposase
MAIYGDAASASTITHLKRELMHAIWELLLDDKFMHAYEHGMVFNCADGVIRRIYPRFFSYAADYPEKYIIH